WDTPTLAWTVWMFGFHRRLVRRWECETDLPKPGPLPQTSHTAATSNSSGSGSKDSSPDALGNSTIVTSAFPGWCTGSIRSPGASLGGYGVRVLDVASVSAWATGCVHSLASLRSAIDVINVYPVADSDT